METTQAEVLCRLLSRSVLQQSGYRTCGQLLPLFMWLLPGGLVTILLLGHTPLSAGNVRAHSQSPCP